MLRERRGEEGRGEGVREETGEKHNQNTEEKKRASILVRDGQTRMPSTGKLRETPLSLALAHTLMLTIPMGSHQKNNEKKQKTTTRRVHTRNALKRGKKMN